MAMDDRAAADTTLKQKLLDALIPSCVVTCEPQEAELAGAFVEDALSESDAMDSSVDLVRLKGER